MISTFGLKQELEKTKEVWADYLVRGQATTYEEYKYQVGRISALDHILSLLHDMHEEEFAE